MTTVDGDEMVVVRNQDGEEYLVDAWDFDHRVNCDDDLLRLRRRTDRRQLQG